MSSGVYALLIVFAAVLLLMAVVIVRSRREQKKTFMKNAADSWGSSLPRLYLSEQIRGLRKYADAKELYPGTERPERSAADPITEEDLQLVQIFGRISRCMSQPGEEVLFDWLLHPETQKEELEHRIGLQEYFAAHQEERLRVQESLYEMKRLRNGSYYGALSSLGKAKRIGRTRYVLLACSTLIVLGLFAVNPLLAVLLLIPDFFIHISVHLRMKKKTQKSLEAFRCLLSLLYAGAGIEKLHIAELAAENRQIAEASASFAAFRRSAALVVTGDSVGTGLGDAVLEYVKMFLHIDLICYDRMMRDVQDCGKEAVQLFTVLGTVDAAISAASFKESLQVSCRPSFEENGGQAELMIRNLYHPLLRDPVPNKLRSEKSILLTGSNASGKSTFLRGAALAALLAQSVGVVPAEEYRAPLFRIFTSMALKDNLLAGQSYFVVEIASLKRIADAAESDESPVLAVVDEVLRGTNTIERIAASAEILKSLSRPHVLVLAATHDVELTELLKHDYRNMHFGEEVVDGDVHFDYLLKEGKADSRNAIRLLRAAGFPEETADAADACASHFEQTGEWTLQ
ncbi:MAG: hypothetical protein Q4B09_06170 [Lachnospiraceae bacterium]|nr:hypothetical protein [Lachnospiraceae bacterium]